MDFSSIIQTNIFTGTERSIIRIYGKLDEITSLSTNPVNAVCGQRRNYYSVVKWYAYWQHTNGTWIPYDPFVCSSYTIEAMYKKNSGTVEFSRLSGS